MSGFDPWSQGVHVNFDVPGGGRWPGLSIQPAEAPFSDNEDASSEPQSLGGYMWRWSDEHQDFITHTESGDVLGYKQFQLAGKQHNNTATAATYGLPGTLVPSQNRPESILRLPSGPPGKPRQRAFEQPLDPKFTYVEKPKRFFSVGRIFKAAWFEPGGQGDSSSAGANQAAASTRSDLEYTKACPAFYGEKPYAKFRWFVVVRKRSHHTLCFSITTFGGKGATKASRGRPQDFVVLYAASAAPPAPDPDEKISRDPIGVIIEGGGQFISPLARLDCGRIYTVEDNLKVMKVGRVHPDHLPTLEAYFKESVS